MKLLLDENISRRIVPALQECYPETTQVALLGLEGHNDKELWEYAKQHGYVVVTQDSDFHEMNLIFGFPPKVIWLKCGNQPKQVMLKRLLDHHADIEAFYHQEQIGCLEIY